VAAITQQGGKEVLYSSKDRTIISCSSVNVKLHHVFWMLVAAWQQDCMELAIRSIDSIPTKQQGQSKARPTKKAFQPPAIESSLVLCSLNQLVQHALVDLTHNSSRRPTGISGKHNLFRQGIKALFRSCRALFLRDVEETSQSASAKSKGGAVDS
jgi:hypothetical protein